MPPGACSFTGASGAFAQCPSPTDIMCSTILPKEGVNRLGSNQWSGCSVLVNPKAGVEPHVEKEGMGQGCEKTRASSLPKHINSLHQSSPIFQSLRSGDGEEGMVRVSDRQACTYISICTSSGHIYRLLVQMERCFRGPVANSSWPNSGLEPGGGAG